MHNSSNISLLLQKLVVVSLLCFVLNACNEQAEKEAPPKETVTNSSFSLPFSWELDAETMSGDTIISIPNEFLFKKDKNYRAFPLKENLDALLPKDLDRTGLQIIFRCTDGYAPGMPLYLIDSNYAYLAFRDMDLGTDEKAWGDSLQAKFAPFYTVWEKYPVDGVKVPWAYGVYEIEINEFTEEYKNSIPTDDTFADGFQLFQNKCMKCHSINMEGGQMGPEFNHPRNITTYWQKEHIWEYVQNPQSFRYNSKMVPIKDLSRAEFEAIYAYLEHIKEKKL